MMDENRPIFSLCSHQAGSYLYQNSQSIKQSFISNEINRYFHCVLGIMSLSLLIKYTYPYYNAIPYKGKFLYCLVLIALNDGPFLGIGTADCTTGIIRLFHLMARTIYRFQKHRQQISTYRNCSQRCIHFPRCCNRTREPFILCSTNAVFCSDVGAFTKETPVFRISGDNALTSFRANEPL